MLEKFIYEDHLGRRFVGLENGVYLNYNDLRDYSWSYETINSRISRFYRAITSRKLPLVVYCGSDEEAVAVKNRLLELSESDIAAKLPGKIYIGDYYTTGYITGSVKSNYLINKRLCNIELTLVSDDPAWYREQTYVFTTGDVEPEVEPEPVAIIEITENGTHDVNGYVFAKVNVSNDEAYNKGYEEGETAGYTKEHSLLQSIIERTATSITDEDLAGVTIIGAGIFRNHTSLKSIAMPDTVIRTKGSVCQFCEKLENVKLSSNLETMGTYEFSGCLKLVTLEIPASVKSIGAMSLHIGDTVQKATITMLGDTPPTIASNTFDAAKLEKIIVPAGCGDVYKSATNWSVFADYIEEKVT